MSHKYSCPHCLRKYKIKTYFDRHVAACQLLHKTSKERTDEIEVRSDTPSHRELYEMLIALAKRNQELEGKIDELTKWANIRKKRLHVKDWLDENYKTVPNVSDIFGNLKITDEDYNAVCEFDYIEGITMIMKRLLPLENENDLPIKAFDQKDNVLFVKKDDGWESMNQCELMMIINDIGKRIVAIFVEWQNKNKSLMSSEKFHDIYLIRLQKVMCANFTKDQVYTRIRRNMYKHLKMNLKNVVQFEFMF